VSGLLSGLRDREEGQDLLEYAMIGGLIAVALLSAFLILGPDIDTMAGNIGDCIDLAGSTACDVSVP
jgi:Flp pilus assembly pilin Flp